MMLELTVLSAAFALNDFMPDRYTCMGINISPPISWSAAPAGTQSIAVIVEDPDAPTGIWTHWVMFNLPPETISLPENVPPVVKLESGAIQGINDFRRVGYGGPCPPPGRPHRYVFKVFALDAMLELGPNMRRPDVLKAMEGHILAQGEITGIYKR